ncbi:MAG: YceI family protein [Acidobacteriaceae bacterium]|nr:YceI family protein [Acidobacteriaceae bacterium]
MKKNMILAAAAALVLAPAMGAFAQTSTWTIDPAHSQSNFEIRHMGISNVRGSISGIKGEIVWDEKDASKDSVVADLDANTVDTTMEARDKHLKSPDFFDVAKNPTIHFQSTKVVHEGGKLVVWGNLTLAGVTKLVKLDVDGPVPPQKGMKGGLVSGFSASTVIKRADFNFGPKFAPPMLGDEVKITLDLEIGKK